MYPGRGTARPNHLYFSLRLCVLVLVPFTTLILGKAILPNYSFDATPVWSEDEVEEGIDFHDVPNQSSSSQLATRFRRNSNSSTNTGTTPMSLYGVSFEYDTEKRHLNFHDGQISILEGSIVNIRLFGIFSQGSKLMLAKTSTSCDDGSPIFPIKLEEMISKPTTQVRQQFNHTFGRVENVVLPTKHEYPEVYFCLWDPDTEIWEPQGSSIATHIQLTSKPLPIWVEIILIIFLLCLSGLFSGLNLGLMSLNKTDLKILINTGTELERDYASRIQPVRNHGNFLLCCLLFSNVLVNATLTILMDGLTSGAVAIVFSTLCIVIFGEIIPQAICSRYGLAVGAKTIYITKFFMLLTFPLAYPLSRILDKCLGEEIGSVYTRERLKELLKVTKDYHGLEHEEVALISGALDMKTKSVSDIMTKLDAVFMLPLDSNLDYDTVSEIEFQGFTRIPVYDKARSNVVAVLNVKQLTLLDASDNIPIRTVVEYYQNSIFYVFENTRLDVIFRAFREGNRGHMAFVQRVNDDGPGDPFYEVIGVVTMEDVLEELLQADILDETDVGKFKARLENKDRPKPFLSKKRTAAAISVPPPLALAACQFLTTAVPAFRRETISENILNRLVKTTVALTKPPKFLDKDLQNHVYLYESGKPSDVFIMILEGRVQVEVGKENLTFQAGPFQCFGSEFLLTKPMDGAHENDAGAPPVDPSITRKHCFVPDYTVRVLSETFYMKVRYGAYCAAKVATELEKKYSSDPNAAFSNQNWRKEVEDILTVVDEDLFKHQRRMLYTDSQDEHSDSEETDEAAKALLPEPPEKDNGNLSDEVNNLNAKPQKDISVPSASGDMTVLFKNKDPLNSKGVSSPHT